MISACAGIGRPVCGPAMTSIGAPLMAPANSYSDWPAGRYSKPAMNSAGSWPLHHRERARLALVPVFLRDDRAVPAGMVELHGDLVPAVHLHAIDRGVDPAAVRIAHDDDRARADIRAAVVTVPDRRGKFARGRRRRRSCVFFRNAASATGDGRVRLQRLALLHPGLERVERAQRRVEAERERGALRVGHGVGEDAEAARKALDVVEQQRRTIRASRRRPR